MLVSTLVRATVLSCFGTPHICPLVFDMQNMSSLSSTSKSRIAFLAQSIHMVSKANNPYFCLIYHPHENAVVRVRSREGRRNRAPPPRVRWKDGKKVNPAVAAAEDAKAAKA